MFPDTIISKSVLWVKMFLLLQSFLGENLEKTQASVSFEPLTLASAGANALVLSRKTSKLNAFFIGIG